MATTTVSANLTRKAWAAKLWREAEKESFWAPFMSEGVENVIQVKTELGTKKGNNITYGLSMKLSGQGRDGDDTLEGHEESMSTYDDNVTIDQKRFGVLLEGEMEEQKACFDMRSEVQQRLKIRWSEWVDESLTRAISGDTTFTFSNTGTAPSNASDNTDRYKWGGNATGVGDLATDDYFATAELERLVTYAKTSEPRILPLRIGGKSWYIVMIHPYQAHTLFQDSIFRNAQQYAMPRGATNPLFTRAMGAWSGALIHVNENCLTFDSSGAYAVDGARALLLGRQAGVVAYGSGPFWREREADYGNKHGFATGRILGIKKAVFNSIDYGVIAMDTYGTSPVGAAHA